MLVACDVAVDGCGARWGKLSIRLVGRRQQIFGRCRQLARRHSSASVQLAIEQKRENDLPADGIETAAALGRFEQERGPRCAAGRGRGGLAVREPCRPFDLSQFQTVATPISSRCRIFDYRGGRPFMAKILLVIGVILMLWSASATAQGRLTVGQCVADLRRLCPDIQPGNDRLRTCMKKHIQDVSSACLKTLATFAEARGSRNDCSAHLRKQCANVDRGQLGVCLRSAVASLSDTCKHVLARAVRRARSR